MPLIAKNENNAENAQQKADGWPGREQNRALILGYLKIWV